MQSTAERGFATLEEAAAAVRGYTPERRRGVNLETLQKNLRLRGGRWHWHWDPRFLGGRLSEALDTYRAAEGSAGVGGGREDELLAAVQRIACPALHIRGARTNLVSREAVAEFQRALPQLEAVDVGDAAHMVAGDANDDFAAAVLAFVERHRSRL